MSETTAKTKKISDILAQIHRIATKDREKTLPIVMQIINNILSNPTDRRYRSLNISRLLPKLSNDIWIQLLIQAGFRKSANENRLIFEEATLEPLEYINSLLSSQTWTEQDTCITDIIFYSLMSNFTDLRGKIHALQEEKVNLNNEQSSLIQIINDGFSVEDAIKALQLSTTNNHVIQNSIKDVHSSAQTQARIRSKCICGDLLIGYPSTELYDGDGVGCDICTGSGDGLFWHCPSEKTALHPGGFDICNACYCGQHETELKHDDNICQHKSQCDNIQNLVKVLKQYNCDILKGMDKSKILCMVNDYLHVMHQHNDDEQFEGIVNRLGGCNIAQCNRLKRNYRNRTWTCNEMKNMDFDNLFENIMDKMHCYFQHSYDIGNRLTLKDKELINNISCVIDNTQEDDMLEKATNKQLQKTYEILQSKRQHNNIFNQRIQSSYSKFNQLDNEYSFGFSFKYGYQDENYDSFDYKSVSKKYDSLKDELTTNTMAILSIKQFNLEYAKAGIHFESFYCKKMFRVETRDYGEINLECILALMVYCNCDQLQCELTKTYRLDEGKQHNEFFWFGKYLKISVHKFGTQIMDGSSDIKFYHGIGEQLLFPKYINGAVLIQPQCPLSTSASLEVAINFTNHNQGILVQFNGRTSSYFSVSWLSNYANEQEYLFIQNAEFSGLNIENITDVNTGCEYNRILDALTVIDRMMMGRFDELDHVSNISHVLMKMIISHQISYEICTYKSFETLSEYGRKLCDTFFKNRQYVYIDYSQWKDEYSFLVDLLCHADDIDPVININAINILFPDMKHLALRNVNLSSSLLIHTLNHMKNHNSKSKQLSTMNIIFIEMSDLSLKQALQKHTKQYRDAEMFIYTTDSDVLCVSNENSTFEFAKHIIDSMGKHDFKDINDEITNLIETLITGKLNSKYKHLFHEWCMKKKDLSINWKNIIRNNNSKIFQRFHHTNYQWIRLDCINKLFPNIQKIKISDIRLCEWTMENILNHFINNKSTIKGILIALGSGRDRAYHYRAKNCPYPTAVQELQIRKKLTNYSKDDNIYENDWGAFVVLYQIRDLLEQRDSDDTLRNENRYHIDSLITSYAALKYKNRFEALGYTVKVYLERFGDSLEIGNFLPKSY
eukprot:424867_1